MPGHQCPPASELPHLQQANLLGAKHQKSALMCARAVFSDNPDTKTRPFTSRKICLQSGISLFGCLCRYPLWRARTSSLLNTRKRPSSRSLDVGTSMDLLDIRSKKYYLRWYNLYGSAVNASQTSSEAIDMATILGLPAYRGKVLMSLRITKKDLPLTPYAALSDA